MSAIGDAIICVEVIMICFWGIISATEDVMICVRCIS